MMVVFSSTLFILIEVALSFSRDLLLSRELEALPQTVGDVFQHLGTLE